MKAQILKHTGLTEKQFYAKYKTQKDFENSKEGKAFKKAQTGMEINKAQLGTSLLPDSNQNGIPDYLENPMGDSRFGQTANYADTRSYQSQPASLQQMGPTQNFSAQSFSSLYTPNAQQFAQNAFQPTDSFAMPNYGQQFINKANQTTSGMRGIPQALPNDVGYTPPEAAGAAGGIGSYMGAATDIIGGIQGLPKQKEEKNKVHQARKVTDIQALAFGTREEEQERRYNTPWDNPVQANQMFPTYGVGTNVITRNGGSIQRAEYGRQISGNPTEIQNTYAPYDIYDDSGYEPLDDSNVKQYYHGGYIRNAQDGMDFSSFMGEQGGAQGIANIGSMFSNGSAEAQIGGGVFEAAGTAIGGPMVGKLVKPLGQVVGGLFNTTQGAIKRDKSAINRNIGTMIGNATGQGLQAQYSSYVKNGGHIPSYEEGGYMNPEYNPQVITMFGDHTAEDFADYANKFRAGGHLKSYTPPSERAMEIYEDGGNVNNYELGGVEVESGGYLEPISYNPYNDGTGITSIIRGQSHDDYDSKLGHSGVILNAYGNQVEAERGEPIREMEEGGSLGEDKSAVITGNLVYKNLNNMFDPNYNKYQGQKIKNIHKEIALKDQKLNELEEKNTNKLLAYDPKNAQDKLYGASLQANEIGYKMQYKNNAESANYFTNHQSIINDTAEEQGLVADDLARGKVKINKEALQEYAEYGKSISKAQNGKTQANEAKPIRTLKFDDGVTRYIYSNGRAMDVNKNGKKTMFTPTDTDVINKTKDEKGNVTYLRANGDIKTRFTNGRVAYKKPDGQRYMATADSEGNLDFDEGDLYDPETGGGTTPAAYAALNAKKGKPAPATTPEPNSNSATNQSSTTTRNTTVNPGTPGSVKGRGDKWDYTTIGSNQTNPEWQTEEAYNTQWSPRVDKALDDSERAKKILNYIKTYKGPNANKVQAALAKFPTEKAQLDYLRTHAKDREISDMHYLMDAGIQSTEPGETKPTETKKAEAAKEEKEKIYPIEPSKRSPWIDAAGQILPFFRPTDQEGLDPNQLSGEMYAMSSNQLEPVQAQGFQPDLGSPYDISYQDQLNANQSDYRAAQRMVGYNPAAQAQLNAQKYQANQGVLGEQFRANQAMKDKVYGENRNILNDAKLKNLEIYDQQYGRQAQAKSNTKAVTQAALNSISDKYAKNKLENRELGIYENMYNYRFDPSGRAVNMNAPWQPNTPNVYNKGNQTANMKALYDQNGNFIKWEPIDQKTTTDETTTAIEKTTVTKNGNKIKSRNGSIVKSYKNI
jgi:hypothetical protein